MSEHMLPHLQRSTKLAVKVLNAFAKHQEHKLRDALARRLIKAWEHSSFPLYFRAGKQPPDAGVDTPAYHFTSKRENPKVTGRTSTSHKR